MCLAYSDSNWFVGIWPGTGTVYGRSDKANDDENDDDFPTIEELLLTKLQEQGFTTEDRDPDKAGGVKEVASEERDSSVDQSRSAQSDNSGRSPGKRAHYTFCCRNRQSVFFWCGVDDPIILLGNNDLSTSEAEVDNISLCAESTKLDTGLFDSPENTVDLITPTPSFSSDGWYNINDSTETALCLRLAEQGASTPNSIHAPPSRLSSEPLHDSIGTVDPHPRRARSEATTSCSAHPRSPPPRSARASPENQLSREGHLHTGRGVADEHGLVGPARNADPVDRRERRQQPEQEEDEDNDEDTPSESEHPPSLQGASVRKCRLLCENSVILGTKAIDPPQADLGLLD